MIVEAREIVRISVIFPAYNEQTSIERTMQRSLEALGSQFEQFEIIIVDDASRDRTGEIADQLAAAHPEIRVIHNAKNMGSGASLMVGVSAAQYDLVTHNAMDYPFDLRDLAKMLPLLKEADVVVAVRTRRAGYTLYRKFISFVNVTLLNLLFGMRLKDYNFVQLYRREALEAASPQTRSTGFVTPEILIRSHDKGFRIRQVPIDYHPRTDGVATSGSWRVIWSSTRDMLKFWWKWHKTKT
jgi:glycosyltransferase involved in cell wall biosynthesis